MSMITGSRAPGAPNAIGLEPRKMRFIPGGTMIGSVCVSATPIMPSLHRHLDEPGAGAAVRAVARDHCAHAAVSRDREIASCMARAATSWPMPASPSTTAAEGPVRLAVMLGRAFTLPLRRRVA